MTRYLCIHGHFYQPPRENPWLEYVELQDSAYPFHDWNDRISAECYAPNSASRILDDDGRIQDIVNNYARISFNFGPTLLAWLEHRQPAVHTAIVEADRQAQKRFSGHGTALAQAYNHLIMPLANARDKRTQVLWGIHDFRTRFGREPEGMWLPETAVDLETLEVLAEEGIRFTILAPHQAARVRKSGDRKWRDLFGGDIDPKRAYRCRLPSERTIDLFFYDGPVAQDVAFGGLLQRGENLARSLTGIFVEDERPQLAHIATDGESYGHHHRFGDMALAYCLQLIEEKKDVQLTNYGEFLERHPPTHEVEIAEESSWSCAHGIERWRSDCGCRIDPHRKWTQAWRAPLRGALDWLRDRVAPVFEEELGRLLPEPWQARDDYIEVILDRTPKTIKEFLRQRAGRALTEEETIRALRLLELQRQTQLMYTSCGWFFDEISGLETTQILGYAGRALQLAEETCDLNLEDGFLERLAEAPSNLTRFRDGAAVYRQAVQPMELDLIRVAAHHAIATEFVGNDRPHEVYCYAAQNPYYRQFTAGRMKLAVGHARVRSQITWNADEYSFAVLHMGGHNLSAGVREFSGQQELETLEESLRDAFENSDIPGIIRRMDRYFGTHNYSLWHLFKDEQRQVLTQVMGRTLESIEASFRQIYENHYTLMRFLQEIGMPIPTQLSQPVAFVLNTQLQRLIEEEDFDPEQFRQLLEEIDTVGVALEETTLGFVAERKIAAMMERFADSPEDSELLQALDATLDVLHTLPMDLDLWRAQNVYFTVRHRFVPEMEERDAAGEQAAARWLRHFRSLGEKLGMRVA